LISNTSPTSEVFTTPIATFEETPNQQKITMLTSLQNLNQVKPMEEASVELAEGAINRLVGEDQVNLGL
jgi:hypothetical protein